MTAIVSPTAFLLVLLPSLTGAKLRCYDGTGRDEIELLLPSDETRVTVPAIPLHMRSYAYAGDNAMAAVPAKCFEQFGDYFGGSPNLADRQPDGPTGMYFFRVSKPDEEYAKLEEMSSCACGLVILLHGTNGVNWETSSYAAMLSGLGYLVVLPDSQSMPADMGLKGAGSLKTADQIDTSNYCGEMNPYEDRADPWTKPFAYSTKVDNILNDTDKYRDYVERNYLIRKLELDSFVHKRIGLLEAFTNVFLYGRSEGAMVASRYFNKRLHSKLSGILLSGCSCEFNYFVSCANNARICEGKCKKDIPVLSMIGETDNYFGAQAGSVAADVAAASNGYGGPLTGNCRRALDDQGFSTSVVVVMKGASHELLYTHDNALRMVVSEFLADPSGTQPDGYPSLTRQGCSAAEDVYTCDAASERPPCVEYEVDENVSFATGSLGACAAPSAEDADVTADSSSPVALAGLAALSVTFVAAGVAVAARRSSNGPDDEAKPLIKDQDP